MKQFTLNIYLKIQLPVSPEFEVHFQEDFVKEVLGTVNHRCFNNSKSVYVNTPAQGQCITLWVGVSNDQNKYSVCKQSIKTDTHFPGLTVQEVEYPHLTDKRNSLILRLTLQSDTVLLLNLEKKFIIMCSRIRALSKRKNPRSEGHILLE